MAKRKTGIAGLFVPGIIDVPVSTTKLAMRDFAVPLQAGSGVAAAIEHFHQTRAVVRQQKAA